MENMERVIAVLYTNLLPIIIKDFESNDIEIVKQQYYTILKNRYLNIEENLKKANIQFYNFEEIYETLYEKEYNEWINLPLSMKKHYLLKDNALIEINNIANQAYKYAQNRLNNNIIINKELANQYIEKLHELSKLVKDYNKELANWHISEGTMDLMYSSGQTDNMSLRIGRLK